MFDTENDSYLGIYWTQSIPNEELTIFNSETS